MLLSPAAAQSRLTDTLYAPQPATESSQKATPTEGLQSNATDAPDWSGGSFRHFGDILNARLEEATGSSSASTSPRTSASNLATASPSKTVNSSGSRVLPAAPKLAEAAPEASGTSEMALQIGKAGLMQLSQTSLPPVKLPADEPQVQATPLSLPTEITSIGTAPQATAKSKPTGSARAQGDAGPPVRPVAQNSSPDASALIGNLTATAPITAAVPAGSQLNFSQSTPNGAHTISRTSGTQTASPATSDSSTETRADSARTVSDSDVFQLDLHPERSLVAGGNSDIPNLERPSENAGSVGSATPSSNPIQTGNSSQVSNSDTEINLPGASKPGGSNPNSQAKILSSGSQDQTPEKAQTAGSTTGVQGVEGPKQTPVQQPASTVGLSPRESASASNATANNRFAQSPGEPADAPHSLTSNQVSVRMEGESGQVVNVRFINQGDQVQVAVRSNDPATTAQLRQGLNSLTDNLDRIGWKTDISALSAHGATSLHDSSRSDSDSQASYKGSGLDWEQGPPKKRYQSGELWEEFYDFQDT